eukprot:7189690-Prymnesium_polylepis.1
MASEGLRGTAADKRSEGCSCELASRETHGDRPSPCVSMASARLSCSPTAFIGGGAAEPGASTKPVSVVQNLSGDLLDGGAEPHYDTDDV